MTDGITKHLAEQNRFITYAALNTVEHQASEIHRLTTRLEKAENLLRLMANGESISMNHESGKYFYKCDISVQDIAKQYFKEVSE